MNTRIANASSAPLVDFAADERQRLVDVVRKHFDEEIGQPIGRFDAESLLDVLLQALGPAIYNRALRDAQAVLAARIDDVQDAILQLEKVE